MTDKTSNISGEEKRRELLKKAKGGWNSLMGLEISLLLIAILYMILFDFDRNVLNLAIGTLLFLTYAVSYIRRRIDALIELIGEENLLKAPEEKKKL